MFTYLLANGSSADSQDGGEHFHGNDVSHLIGQSARQSQEYGD